jgi:hypothetical protein
MMKALKTSLVILGLVLFAAFKGCPPKNDNQTSQPASSQPTAVLNRAVLNTVTGGDNKDHDTCVWATVKTADNATLLAQIENGNCGGDNTTEYRDHESKDITFQLETTGATKDACKGFRVHLWQKTHGGGGHDKWIVNEANATLYFSDGLNLTAHSDGFTLESNGEDDAPARDFANTL